MSIEFAGVGLAVPTPDLQTFLDRWWDASRSEEWDFAGYAPPRVAHLPRRAAPRREPPRLGVLHWPTGADRWATFHHLVRDDQLDRIRRAVLPTASAAPSAGTLTVSDGRKSSADPLKPQYAVSTAMWMLPPRAVCDVAGRDRLWLLTLVDDRYWWWYSRDQKPADTYATWADLFGGLLALVGVDSAYRDVATIPAAYSTPTTRWAVGYEPLPAVLEAAARSVGCRVVRGLDGVVHVRRYDDARTAADAVWSRYAGDRLSGGKDDARLRAVACPASVAVIFSGDPETASTKTLASLGLAEYSGLSGAANRVGHVRADMLTTASSGDRSTLATEAAKDYYRWRTADLEATFRGAVKWEPTGLEGGVEWGCRYGADGSDPAVLTRVLRPVREDDGDGYPPATDSGGGGTTVHLVTVTGSYSLGAYPCSVAWPAGEPDGTVTETNDRKLYNGDTYVAVRTGTDPSTYECQTDGKLKEVVTYAACENGSLVTTTEFVYVGEVGP